MKKSAKTPSRKEEDSLSQGVVLPVDHIELALRGQPQHIQAMLERLSATSGTLWNFATSRSIAVAQTEVAGTFLSDKLNGPKLRMLSPNSLILYGNRCVSAATAIGVVIADPNGFVTGIKGTESVQEVGDALYYAGL